MQYDARMISRMWLLAPTLALKLTLPDPPPIETIAQIAAGR